MKNLKTIGLGTTVAAILAMTSLDADAVSFGFTRITSTASQNVASQLSVDVTDAGSGKVDFTFRNAVGIASSITDIYFDAAIFTSSGITAISDSGAGVAFSEDASPGNLPSGNNISFQTTDDDFSADSDSPVSGNGVNSSSEWVKITFSLLAGKTFNDVLNAMQWALDNPNNSSDSGLRIGLHVQSIGTSGKSDSFVNGPRKSVPDAGSTFALLGLGLGAMALARRKTV